MSGDFFVLGNFIGLDYLVKAQHAEGQSEFSKAEIFPTAKSLSFITKAKNLFTKVKNFKRKSVTDNFGFAHELQTQ